MKAIILAAGYGKRLGKLTRDRPKPTIEVGGTPCIVRIIDHLNLLGIYQIIVNTHYLPEKLMKCVGSRALYFYEPELLGEEGTLKALHGWIDELTVVMNGDTLTNIDIHEMVQLTGERNAKYMDNGVYAGTRIVRPDYFVGSPDSVEYEPEVGRFFWIDIGTLEGLERANEQYKEKTG